MPSEPAFEQLYGRLIAAISRITAAHGLLDGVREELDALDRALADAGVPSDTTALIELLPALVAAFPTIHGSETGLEAIYRRAVEIGIRAKYAIALSGLVSHGTA